jgi:hypothetical protein
MFEILSKGAVRNAQKGFFRRLGGGGGCARNRPHRQFTEGEGEDSKKVHLEAAS